MKDRLRELFKTNAQTGKPLIVDKAEKASEATVYLYDVIGESFWGGISAKALTKELAALDAKIIHLRINSPGGDVFEARAMQTALAQHAAKVVVHVDGVAASAATFLAMAADEIEMAEGAMFMIHKAWGFAIGNQDDMLEYAGLLEKVDNTIAKDYERRTGLGIEEIGAMMAAETWLTADEAKEKGFVDSIYKPEKAADAWDLSAYDNPPKPQERPEPEGPDNELIAKRLRLVAA